MPRRSWSAKRERQYEHIKENELERGRSEGTAERIAAATVNRTRTAKGETKTPQPKAKRERAKRAAQRTGRRNASRTRGR